MEAAILTPDWSVKMAQYSVTGKSRETFYILQGFYRWTMQLQSVGRLFFTPNNLQIIVIN